MFIVGYFLQAVAQLAHIVFVTVMILVFARAVLSWVSPDPYNPIVRTVIQLTEPLLYPVRRRLPMLGGLDLSPLVVILAAAFLDNFLVPSLSRIALNLVS